MCHIKRCSKHCKVHPLDFIITFKFHEGLKVDVIAKHSMEATAFDTIKRGIMVFVTMSVNTFKKGVLDRT